MLDYCPADNQPKQVNCRIEVCTRTWATLIFSLSSFALFLFRQANYVMLNCALWSMALLITVCLSLSLSCHLHSAFFVILCFHLSEASFSLCTSVTRHTLGQLNGAQFCLQSAMCKWQLFVCCLFAKEWIFKALLPSASPSSKKAIYLHCHYTIHSLTSLLTLCPLCVSAFNLQIANFLSLWW